MYITVRVTPNAKKEVFSVISETEFEISVKEPAKQNLANKRIIELVSGYFKVSPKEVRIITGHHSPKKVLDVPVHELK